MKILSSGKINDTVKGIHNFAYHKLLGNVWWWQLATSRTAVTLRHKSFPQCLTFGYYVSRVCPHTHDLRDSHIIKITSFGNSLKGDLQVF